MITKLKSSLNSDIGRSHNYAKTIYSTMPLS